MFTVQCVILLKQIYRASHPRALLSICRILTRFRFLFPLSPTVNIQRDRNMRYSCCLIVLSLHLPTTVSTRSCSCRLNVFLAVSIWRSERANKEAVKTYLHSKQQGSILACTDTLIDDATLQTKVLLVKSSDKICCHNYTVAWKPKKLCL